MANVDQFLVGQLFLAFALLSVYEMFLAWENNSAIIQFIRPTILRTRIHFESDMLIVLNHKLDALNETNTKVYRESKAIHFQTRSRMFDFTFRRAFKPAASPHKMASSSPISGIIKLRHTEIGTVGDIVGKIPFSQTLFMAMFIVGLPVYALAGKIGIVDSHFGVANVLPIAIFAIVVFSSMIATERVNFTNSLNEIVESYNKAGIETVYEPLKWNIKSKSQTS